MLATFIFAYRLGLGTLTPALKTLLFGVVGLLIVSDAISFILASTLVRLAVIGAGYTLGSQKIPWKSAVAVISLISVLHAGKAEMREKYWNQDGANRSFSLFEYPLIFGEWFANGVKVLGQKKGEGERDVQSAAERGAMVQILFRIMEWSPSRKPFLEGETYKEIPALLVPRILYKEKGIAHIGNWILAYYYEFLTLEGLSKTSVGFDLLSESYANFGYVGMGFLAVFLGIFYAWVGRLSIGVPLLSLRFLFAVLVLSGTFSSNNTMGVFVTTLWQSSMVLLTLGMLLTKKMPNPLYVQAKVAPAKDPGLGASGKGQVAGGGPTSLQASQTREELRRVQDEVATGGQGSVVGGHPSTISEGPSTNSVRHERPKRFVYGKQENKS
jgi:hypothetical protein